MKRLYILRHAQAMPAGGSSDFERNLTAKGVNDAKILGARMRDLKYQPDYILCSPARRTSQTLEGVLQSVQKPHTQQPRIIYEGGVKDLWDLIRYMDDAYNALLLVGHNPSMHQLVFELAEDSGDFVKGLSAGYPPATLSVLDCPGSTWAQIKPHRNVLKDLLATDGV